MNSTNLNWVPLKLLESRFSANVTALATRNPAAAEQLLSIKPGQPYFIRSDADRVFLGTGNPIAGLPHPLPPDEARRVMNKIFPESKCTESVLIAGEDLGWLLNAVYRLPCCHAPVPGHRPPLYFLMRDLERLWAILHVQDWRDLLADRRVRCFVGTDAAAQLEQGLMDDTLCPWPKLAFTLDPAIWPAGVSYESTIVSVGKRHTESLAKVLESLKRDGGLASPRELARRIESGAPLRILGLTSLYTTFLQYSMRDWLAGLEQLGHQTRLVIEEHDHQIGNRLALTQVCTQYRPDLILAIDHTRQTLHGVLEEIPVVTWVQDRLSNIFNKSAGENQGQLDYTMGYARSELTHQFGYPASRFMPAMMAVNEQRFSPRQLTAAELDQYGCDVSFVSHATRPADEIVQAEIAKQDNPRAKAMLDDVYQQLTAIYQGGGWITAGELIEKMIDESRLRHGVKVGREQIRSFFIHQVNNALFRHQAIRWVADLGVNLHLYGKGWENHPEFSRYAKGEANNRDQLRLICQASKINLQVTPFGAVHQRLLEGLAAGGFFLLRAVTADDLELILRDMDTWCKAKNIRSGSEMLARQDAELLALADRYKQLGGVDPLSQPDYFFSGMQECAICDWTRTANTLWPQSEGVTFSTVGQLQEQVSRFLASPMQRWEIARSMRQRVLETHTYSSVSQRMLQFIAGDLHRLSPPVRARAA